jgi:hypothetical protein
MKGMVFKWLPSCKVIDDFTNSSISGLYLLSVPYCRPDRERVSRPFCWAEVLSALNFLGKSALVFSG